MTRPDFVLADFDPHQLPDLLHQRGAVLLRQVLPPELLSRWLPAFETAFERSDQVFATGQMDAHTWSCFRQFGLVNPLDVTGFYLWIQELFRQPRLQQVLQHLFATRPWLLLTDSAVRRQSPQQPRYQIHYHQDHEFLGQFEQALNVWIPLTAAGNRQPGLELWLDGPQQVLLNLQMSQAEREAVWSSIPATQLWQPELAAGDLIIFTHYTVHRTWVTPNMEKNRYSFEMRLISDQERQQCTRVVMACDP